MIFDNARKKRSESKWICEYFDKAVAKIGKRKANRSSTVSASTFEEEIERSVNQHNKQEQYKCDGEQSISL